LIHVIGTIDETPPQGVAHLLHIFNDVIGTKMYILVIEEGLTGESIKHFDG
jgi:hypothetical protein